MTVVLAAVGGVVVGVLVALLGAMLWFAKAFERFW